MHTYNTCESVCVCVLVAGCLYNVYVCAVICYSFGKSQGPVCGIKFKPIVACSDPCMHVYIIYAPCASKFVYIYARMYIYFHKYICMHI